MSASIPLFSTLPTNLTAGVTEAERLFDDGQYQRVLSLCYHSLLHNGSNRDLQRLYHSAITLSRLARCTKGKEWAKAVQVASNILATSKTVAIHIKVREEQLRALKKLGRHREVAACVMEALANGSELTHKQKCWLIHTRCAALHKLRRQQEIVDLLEHYPVLTEPSTPHHKPLFKRLVWALRQLGRHREAGTVGLQGLENRDLTHAERCRLLHETIDSLQKCKRQKEVLDAFDIENIWHTPSKWSASLREREIWACQTERKQERLLQRADEGLADSALDNNQRAWLVTKKVGALIRLKMPEEGIAELRKASAWTDLSDGTRKGLHFFYRRAIGKIRSAREEDRKPIQTVLLVIHDSVKAWNGEDKPLVEAYEQLDELLPTIEEPYWTLIDIARINLLQRLKRWDELLEVAPRHANDEENSKLKAWWTMKQAYAHYHLGESEAASDLCLELAQTPHLPSTTAVELSALEGLLRGDTEVLSLQREGELTVSPFWHELPTAPAVPKCLGTVEELFTQAPESTDSPFLFSPSEEQLLLEAIRHAPELRPAVRSIGLPDDPLSPLFIDMRFVTSWYSAALARTQPNSIAVQSIEKEAKELLESVRSKSGALSDLLNEGNVHKLVVDRPLERYGLAAFNQEPGSAAGGYRGMRFALENIHPGEITPELYIALHDATLQGSFRFKKETWSPAALGLLSASVRFSIGELDRDPIGLADISQRARTKDDGKSDSPTRPLFAWDGNTLKIPHRDKRDRDSEDYLKWICDRYNGKVANASSAEERLLAAIWFVREAEINHLFNDGNGRTSTAALIALIRNDPELPDGLPIDPNILDFNGPEKLLSRVMEWMINAREGADHKMKEVGRETLRLTELETDHAEIQELCSSLRSLIGENCQWQQVHEWMIQGTPIAA